MSRRRVVITGLGAVTPTGNNVQEFWQGICAGKAENRIDHQICTPRAIR